ncbi:MAG: hypothetical protein JJ895_03825 [Balneolaceae bacterium]|nr:hypothetical protein [Balneolaceae bacterium]
MTINFITSSDQVGKGYKVMATLLLPSIWKPAMISSLQIGLAEALSKYISLSVEDVHVITNIIDSGMVVENGQEITW